MRILFVTLSDIGVCSSSNIRNVSLIKGLVDTGNTVDIISYKTSNAANLKDESFASKLEGCKVTYLTANVATEKISANLNSSKGQKIDIKKKIYNVLRDIYYRLEPVDSLRKIAQTVDIEGLDISDYDCMISSSNPYSVHILAKRIKDKYFPQGIKWVQYWGDTLYLDTLTRTPLFPSSVKKAEAELIKDANAVIYTNGVCLKMQKKLFPKDADKMHFIETPFAFFDDNEEKIEYSVGYFGSYSKMVRDIEPLYNVLSTAEYKSIIIGNGDIEIASSENLTVLPRVPVDEVNKYEGKTDILVCLCNKLSKKGKESGTIPGKAYHYGATTKRVLMIDATPEVKKFLKSYDRYIFAENNEESIRKTLGELIVADRENITPLKEVMPQNAAAKVVSIISAN